VWDERVGGQAEPLAKDEFASGSVDGLLAFAMRASSSAARLRRQALIALVLRRGAIRGAK
jgi:hypothetical protein